TIQVMYGGRIMERGPTRGGFHDPPRAYTWGLLRSLPGGGPATATRLFQIPRQPPHLIGPPGGGPFAPRHPLAAEQCFRETPPLRAVAPNKPDHLVAAWYDLRAALAANGDGVR